MQDLIKQEQFELEVLDKFKSRRFLDSLVLGGGTMLRLCFGLDRFSIDLDFWIIKNLDVNKLFKDLKEYLSGNYTIKDCANKFYTLLFEIKSKGYPRSLKIEIRKETKKIKTELAIAYSKYSNRQVLLRAVSLEDMMREKINAFLNRQEIRDVFDIEFLLKKGIPLESSSEILQKLLKKINSLDKRDYTVKLGSILEEDKRKYYISENFKIVKLAIEEKI
ncbi:MAG: nucleotidyl transferase AbiEii/AbiGii toxin family protein [Candidatus Omnitrophica bacterium]|nr:nucleotidyl transferase AbiEii/AbiGii toxin family protein [Candidatus Omnitrophota bacterium]